MEKENKMSNKIIFIILGVVIIVLIGIVSVLTVKLNDISNTSSNNTEEYNNMIEEQAENMVQNTIENEIVNELVNEVENEENIILEGTSNYYEHPPEWYEEQRALYGNGDVTSNNTNNSNNSSNSNVNNENKNTNVSTKLEDVLNDVENFTKYELKIINNAMTLKAAEDSGYNDFKYAKEGHHSGPIIYINSEVSDTAIFSKVSLMDNITKDKMDYILDRECINVENEYLYIRKGIDIYQISIEFEHEYKTTKINDTYSVYFGFVFTPKLNINGNVITLELNSDCITSRFYG